MGLLCVRNLARRYPSTTARKNVIKCLLDEKFNRINNIIMSLSEMSFDMDKLITNTEVSVNARYVHSVLLIKHTVSIQRWILVQSPFF